MRGQVRIASPAPPSKAAVTTRDPPLLTARLHMVVPHIGLARYHRRDESCILVRAAGQSLSAAMRNLRTGSYPPLAAAGFFAHRNSHLANPFKSSILRMRHGRKYVEYWPICFLDPAPWPGSLSGKRTKCTLIKRLRRNPPPPRSRSRCWPGIQTLARACCLVC